MTAYNLFRTCLLIVLISTGAAWAQTFKMPCEVEGVIPDLDDRKVKAEKVVVEIQSMGKNIFLKINGSKLYQTQASSLTTEEFVGKNLTTEKQMGATRKHKATGQESEIRIDRETVTLFAFHDLDYRGRTIRMNITGPCTPPQ
jgi:hypothetical protein